MRTRWWFGVAGGVLVVVWGLFVLLVGCQPPALPGIHLDTIDLPAGFEIELASDAVPGARSLTWGAEGTLFVGTRGTGVVYALGDDDGDGRFERVAQVTSGRRQPNGVAFRDGTLYVAEISRILAFDAIEAHLDDPPEPRVVYDGLPRDRHHGWKFIAFGPDGHLYVPVGAPGNNVLREDDPRYASITRIDLEAGTLEVFAHGVRNTVGFDWHPETDELWFTDNGRDWMGDDQPPDELNHAPGPGLHFGFPFWHGKDVRDPEFGDPMDPDAFVPPALELGAHVAALGMRFYAHEAFPARYRGGVFVAEHGSWNRTVPVGYRVAFVPFEDGRPAGYETFAAGWLNLGTAWGRPVDVLPAPDGSLLVSDDRAGAIYRIRHTGD